MKILVEVKAIPYHEVIFVFKNGKEGFDLFISCIQKFLSVEKQAFEDKEFYIKTHNDFHFKSRFRSIVHVFKTKGYLNLHLFHSKLIMDTLFRICGLEYFDEDRQQLRSDINNKYVVQIEKYVKAYGN